MKNFHWSSVYTNKPFCCKLLMTWSIFSNPITRERTKTISVFSASSRAGNLKSLLDELTVASEPRGQCFTRANLTSSVHIWIADLSLVLLRHEYSWRIGYLPFWPGCWGEQWEDVRFYQTGVPCIYYQQVGADWQFVGPAGANFLSTTCISLYCVGVLSYRFWKLNSIVVIFFHMAPYYNSPSWLVLTLGMGTWYGYYFLFLYDLDTS